MNIYISNHLGFTIVAPCNFCGGISSEIEGATVKVPYENPSDLGQAFVDGLGKTTADRINLSNKGKLKDWPALNASALQTGKEFERNYVRYFVKGVNEANHFCSIVSPKLPNGIELSISVRVLEIPLQIGIEIIKIHEYYAKCLKNI